MTKKIDKDSALARIKVLISNFYEKVGRDIIDMDEKRGELIEAIEDVLNNTKVSMKHQVIERLNLDNEINNSLKGRWKAESRRNI